MGPMPALLCPSKCQDPEISPALLWAFTATLEIGQDSNYCPHVTKEVTEAQTGEVTCPKPHSQSQLHTFAHTPGFSLNSQGDAFLGFGGGRSRSFSGEGEHQQDLDLLGIPTH